MIGLGRTGANMAERLRGGGREVMPFDPPVAATAARLAGLRDLIDRGNSNLHDAQRRHAAAGKRGLHLLERLHAACAREGGTLERIGRHVDDSGEGGWTIRAAIAADAKVNPALGSRFGGHAVRAAVASSRGEGS